MIDTGGLANLLFICNIKCYLKAGYFSYKVSGDISTDQFSHESVP